jgi:prophage maintenance system killer protein
MNTQNSIVIYEAENGQTQIEVRLEQETLWLSLSQIVDLFERDKSVISRHLKNIFDAGELDRISVVAKNATTAADGKTYQVEFYNLDAILSVGYRVNSKKGTQFRIWANSILKQYLLQGYVLNEQKLSANQEKLADLRQAIALSSRLSRNKDLSLGESQGIWAILEKYSHALTVLDNYDHQRLTIEGAQKATQAPITYDEAIAQIHQWRKQERLTELFGNEKDDSFKGSLATIYQTFVGAELYPSIEEKAENLLYFIVKNHSFSDGNKRIAAAIFAWFLQRHDYLYNTQGEKRIADNALVAFTLLIAESRPEEKEMIVKVIINLINGANG